MEKEQQKYYARGYSAGKRKGRENMEGLRPEIKRQVINEHERNKIYDKYFCAALSGLASGEPGWTLGDEKVTSAKMYVRLAKIFADQAMEQNKR